MNDTLYYGCSPTDKNSKMQEKCIPASLRCDGHVNCGEGLHTDESGCAVGTSSKTRPFTASPWHECYHIILWRSNE